MNETTNWATGRGSTRSAAGLAVVLAAGLCLLLAACGGSDDDGDGGDDGSALDAADVAPSTESAPTSTRDPDAPPAWQPSTLPPEPPEFWVELDEMWESQREMRLEQTRQAQREADRQAEWEAMDWDEQSGCHVEDFRCVEAWHAATTTTTTAPPPTTTRRPRPTVPAPSTTAHKHAEPAPTTSPDDTSGWDGNLADTSGWDGTGDDAMKSAGVVPLDKRTRYAHRIGVMWTDEDACSLSLRRVVAVDWGDESGRPRLIADRIHSDGTVVRRHEYPINTRSGITNKEHVGSECPI